MTDIVPPLIFVGIGVLIKLIGVLLFFDAKGIIDIPLPSDSGGSDGEQTVNSPASCPPSGLQPAQCAPTCRLGLPLLFPTMIALFCSPGESTPRNSLPSLGMLS